MCAGREGKGRRQKKMDEGTGGERVASESIHVVAVDHEIQPDNSFPDAHAIYLILSEEPSDRWIKEFEHVCRLRVATRRRTITVVGNRLRVVISPENTCRPCYSRSKGQFA